MKNNLSPNTQGNYPNLEKKLPADNLNIQSLLFGISASPNEKFLFSLIVQLVEQNKILTGKIENLNDEAKSTHEMQRAILTAVTKENNHLIGQLATLQSRVNQLEQQVTEIQMEKNKLAIVPYQKNNMVALFRDFKNIDIDNGPNSTIKLLTQ